MHEFGEIAIDSKIVTGKNGHMAELGGGCVCCALLGEFEAAVHEILATVTPEWIVVETTSVAEPDALVLEIEENVPAVRLDGVVTVTDADAMVRFPQLGHTTQLQIEATDLLVLACEYQRSDYGKPSISYRLLLTGDFLYEERVSHFETLAAIKGTWQGDPVQGV